MCIFSQNVEEVSSTNIFARGSNGNQFLVYRMIYTAADELAMVLPLPVPIDTPEDAVRFINLEKYADFFDHLRLGFPVVYQPRGRGVAPLIDPNSTLTVHDVGAFEASFVPTLNDFERLDERFRISTDIWNKLPAYHDFGFAVFKLKGSSERQTVHPMAFEFPSRNPDLLYFPTIHIHNGMAHSKALFDHTLYCQVTPDMLSYVDKSRYWHQSFGNVSEFMSVSRSEGIIDGSAPCWRLILKGSLENKDTFVGMNSSIPRLVR